MLRPLHQQLELRCGPLQPVQLLTHELCWPHRLRSLIRPRTFQVRTRRLLIERFTPGRVSIHGLSRGKGPPAVQDFGARTIEAHCVVPALHDRQTVGNLVVAAAELDRDRAIATFLRSEVVERLRVVLVSLEVALGVIDAHRPECVDGYIQREPWSANLNEVTPSRMDESDNACLRTHRWIALEVPHLAAIVLAGNA